MRRRGIEPKRNAEDEGEDDLSVPLSPLSHDSGTSLAYVRAVELLKQVGDNGKPECPAVACGTEEGLLWVSPILCELPSDAVRRESRAFSAATRNATISNVVSVGGHTEYVIVMKCHGEEWRIQRRYREFRELHTALQREFASQYLSRHVVPPKKTFGNKEQDFVAERRMLLQHYIRELLNDQIISQSVTFRNFVEFDSHVDHVVMMRLNPSVYSH